MTPGEQSSHQSAPLQVPEPAILEQSRLSSHQTHSDLARPLLSREGSFSNQQMPPQASPSRRRTSSFGFGSSFFSNLTSSLRNGSYSTSNLQSRPNQSPQSRSRAGSQPSRSRTGSSSSRLNLIQTAQVSILPANNSPRANTRTNSTPNLPGVNIVTPYNGSTERMDPMNVGTPTEEAIPQINMPQNPAYKLDSDGTYSVRLTPFIDHSANSQGLYFSPVLRKTKPSCKLSIGRYTDKVREAAQAPSGSDAPIVFKSKVVSRTHAEFYVDMNGNWYVKDLKSSSGTFLNHMRLSPAGVESELTAIQNGDVLQLGMDFRGGIEDVFRCVKMRVEVNKSWQRKANQFNKDAHERFKTLALLDESEMSECAICLFKIKPCQAVFIGPCSHAWHYKCIRPIIVKSYPQFLCPNCRETCDLEADDEESELERSDDEDDVMEDGAELKPRQSNDCDESTSTDESNST